MYDSVTKQSRPIRKYLGTEDPETGGLIPSSGKRGRKKEEAKVSTNREKSEVRFKEKYEKLLADCNTKEARIKQLEYENKRLQFCIQKLRDTANAMIKGDDL